MTRALMRSLLALAALACGPPPSAEELRPLSEVEQLRTRFAADAGRPRLVLLLSPT